MWLCNLQLQHIKPVLKLRVYEHYNDLYKARPIILSICRLLFWTVIELLLFWTAVVYTRGGSRTAATFKMERFVIVVNGWKPLTILTKCSILDAAENLEPPLYIENTKYGDIEYWEKFCPIPCTSGFFDILSFL